MSNNYNAQDINNVLYNAISVPITADGYSSEIDLGRDGGCPDAEIVFSITDIEAGESIFFTIYDYVDGNYAATAYRLYPTADGVYVWPIDNRVITGSKFKLAHDITLSTTTEDGIKIHAHVRVDSLS